MSKVHRLQPAARTDRPAEPPGGELVPLPFVDLETVVESMKMLRKFPNQNVLDNFNRATPREPSP